jgi:hypothetical protein
MLCRSFVWHNTLFGIPIMTQYSLRAMALLGALLSCVYAFGTEPRDLIMTDANVPVSATKQTLNGVLAKARRALQLCGRDPATYRLRELKVVSAERGIRWSLWFRPKGEYIVPDSDITVEVDDASGEVPCVRNLFPGAKNEMESPNNTSDRMPGVATPGESGRH